MSKTNETPTGAGPTAGPWRVVGGPADDYQDGAYEIVGDDGAVAVAHVCRDNGDAALLAASPTMLAALKAIALHCRPDGLEEWAAKAKSYPLELARAAIRAAEGGAA